MDAVCACVCVYLILSLDILCFVLRVGVHFVNAHCSLHISVKRKHTVDRRYTAETEGVLRFYVRGSGNTTERHTLSRKPHVFNQHGVN